MKKIIVVDTTYRANGNCACIADKLAAEIPDAQVEVFRLKEKNVNPCLGCDVCKKKEAPACVQKDDMGALVERIDQCDGLVIAAPIYFGGICGQAKTFIDRLYCFYNPARPGASAATKRGKKAAIVCACGGGPVDVYTAHAQGLAGSLGVMGADETKALVLGGIFAAGSVRDNAEYQQQLSGLAKWLGE